MFPSPALRRIRIPTLTVTTPPAPANMAPTPHSLSAPRMSFVRIPRLLCGSVFPLRPGTTLPDVLWAILAAPQPRSHTTEFVVEWKTAAATHNLAVICRYDGNLCGALAAQPSSTPSSGSEFRLAHQLAPLLLRHPLWAAFAERITDGAESPSSTFPTLSDSRT